MEWIKVEDRLPKDDSFYLIAFDDRGIRFGSYLQNDGWRDVDGKLYDGIVTHWMPLPDPPNG